LVFLNSHSYLFIQYLLLTPASQFLNIGIREEDDLDLFPFNQPNKRLLKSRKAFMCIGGEHHLQNGKFEKAIAHIPITVSSEPVFYTAFYIDDQCYTYPYAEPIQIILMMEISVYL
jgi:hypothetical protein